MVAFEEGVEGEGWCGSGLRMKDLGGEGGGRLLRVGGGHRGADWVV